MKTRGGYIQGYNVQAAADTDHRVIVAQGLTAEGSDQRQLEHMIKAIKTSEKRLPKELSADSGYCSERNLEILEDSGILGYVATGRQAHGKAAATGAKARHEGTFREKMARRLKTGGTVSTGGASSPSSRSSDRSCRRAASGSSCCAAFERCDSNGRWSVPPTTS